MRNAYHPRRDIFGQRMELIRQLLVAWLPGDHVTVDRQWLADTLRPVERAGERIAFGHRATFLQLNAVVLLAGVEFVWTEATAKYYIDRVLAAVDSDEPLIYQPAAFLLGLVLERVLGERSSGAAAAAAASADCPHDDSGDSGDVSMGAAALDEPLLQPVLRRLNGIRTAAAASEAKRFTDILYAVHRNYPRIGAAFLVPIANYIPKTQGAVRRQLLDVFLASMDAYGAQMCRELHALGLRELLHTAEFEMPALHCMNKAMRRATEAEWLELWPLLERALQSRTRDARAVCYEMLVHVVVRAKEAGLQSRALALLLRGFADADAGIRARVFGFWSRCDQLPAQVSGMLQGCL